MFMNAIEGHVTHILIVSLQGDATFYIEFTSLIFLLCLYYLLLV